MRCTISGGMPLGADHAVPKVEIERRIALLAVGRDIGGGDLLGDGERPDLAVLDVGRHGRRAAAQHLQVARGSNRPAPALCRDRARVSPWCRRRRGRTRWRDGSARPARSSRRRPCRDRAGKARPAPSGCRAGTPGWTHSTVGSSVNWPIATMSLGENERRLVQDRIDRVAAGDRQVGVAVGRRLDRDFVKAGLPPAPGLLSTSMVWPSRAEIFSATSREVKSEPPPGANGATSLSGRDGQTCAEARPRKADRRGAGQEGTPAHHGTSYCTGHGTRISCSGTCCWAACMSVSPMPP